MAPLTFLSLKSLEIKVSANINLTAVFCFLEALLLLPCTLHSRIIALVAVGDDNFGKERERERERENKSEEMTHEEVSEGLSVVSGRLERLAAV